MPKYLKSYDSDYIIASKPGGEIRLDTGNLQGTVVVTGDLTVKGTTTTVKSEEVTIKDNIIVLNKGELGSGVTQGTAGFEIDRGAGALPVRWVYDEGVSWQLGGLSSSLLGVGTFYAQAGTQKLPINTPGIVAGGNLFVDTGSGVISVTGTANYEEKIFNYVNGKIEPDSGGNILVDNDHIPNAKSVVDLVDYNFDTKIASVIGSRIQQGDTRVQAVDETHVLEEIFAIIHSSNGTTTLQTLGPHGFSESDTVNIFGLQANGDPLEEINQTNINIVEVVSETVLVLDVSAPNANPAAYVEGSGTIQKVGAVPSEVLVEVDGNRIATFLDNSADILGIRFESETITTAQTDQDILIKADGIGSVKIDNTLEIKTEDWSSSQVKPQSVNDGIKIYAQDESAGKTGLFYVNSSNTRDEIVSKNRSLLFSMLF